MPVSFVPKLVDISQTKQTRTRLGVRPGQLLIVVSR